MDVVMQKCGEILFIYFPQKCFPTHTWELITETWLMEGIYIHIYIPIDTLVAIYCLTHTSIDVV